MIEKIPNKDFYAFINNCRLNCFDCPIYYPTLERDLVCEALSKEQLLWLLDNADKLKRWLKL